MFEPNDPGCGVFYDDARCVFFLRYTVDGQLHEKDFYGSWGAFDNAAQLDIVLETLRAVASGYNIVANNPVALAILKYAIPDLQDILDWKLANNVVIGAIDTKVMRIHALANGNYLEVHEYESVRELTPGELQAMVEASESHNADPTYDHEIAELINRIEASERADSTNPEV